MSQRKPPVGSDIVKSAALPSQPLESDTDAEMRQLQWAGLSLEGSSRCGAWRFWRWDWPCIF